MKYQVMRIEEDLDFGCEERGADEPVMAVVVLKDENGTESRIRCLLYTSDAADEL